MNIDSFDRSKQVFRVAVTNRAEICCSAQNFIMNLRGIDNTAEEKGRKVANVLQKTVKSAVKLSESAEKGNINGMLKNFSKLQTNSENLFCQTSSPFTRSAIAAATKQLSNIKSALLNN